MCVCVCVTAPICVTAKGALTRQVFVCLFFVVVFCVLVGWLVFITGSASYGMGELE